MTGNVEGTAKEFDDYIVTLSHTETCKFMQDMHGIVMVCNHTLFSCPYRSREVYHHRHGETYECNRLKMMKLRHILRS